MVLVGQPDPEGGGDRQGRVGDVLAGRLQADLGVADRLFELGNRADQSGEGLGGGAAFLGLPLAQQGGEGRDDDLRVGSIVRFELRGDTVEVRVREADAPET